MATAGNQNTLIITEIPVNENNALNLFNHFGKFGKFDDYTLKFNGDPTSASITFDTSEAANAAINSNEAYLNNRFIKITSTFTPNESTFTQNESASESTASSNAHDHNEKCTLCNRIFVSKWHLDFHTTKYHSGTGIKCDICNALFTSKNMYQKHYIVKHPNVSIPNKIPQPKQTIRVNAINNSPKQRKFNQSMQESFSLQLQIQSLQSQLDLSFKAAKLQREKYKTLKEKKKTMAKVLQGLF